MKPREKDLICELDASDIEQLEKIDVCKKACQKMIIEVAKHWEDNEIANKAIWNVLRKKYDLKKIETEKGLIIIDNKIYHNEEKALRRFKLEEEINEYLESRMLNDKKQDT
jgi:hypothetical protein